MNRQGIVIKSSKDYGSPYNRHICIDLENQESIYACIADKQKKFWQIVERTLTQNWIYWDHYAKETINAKSKKIAAIKFFDADNTRIYCKEVSTVDGNFYIICAIELTSKKVQKNDKRIDAIINAIANYQYEIIK